MALIDKIKVGSDKQNITITVIDKNDSRVQYKINEGSGTTTKYECNKEYVKQND